MEPFGEKIIDKCMQLVEVEAEDNAVLCLKIIMDFCRHHVKTLPTAEKFLQLILNIFDSMPQRIRDTFDASASQPAAVNAPANAANNAGTPDTPSASAGTANGNAGTAAGESLPTGSQSFKVIAECPIIVVSIFQNHRPIGPKQVVKFTPRIKAALLLQAPAQKKAHDEA
jgi:transformation/transcription domain-associated protein